MKRAERFLLGIESGSSVDVVDVVNADQDDHEDHEAHFDVIDDDHSSFVGWGSEDRGYDPLEFQTGPAFDESDCYDAVGF